jgi:predicted nuclease of predicted toxin-antitoxin system
MGTLASELRPIAATLAACPRVYVDANVPLGVVTFMRQRLRWDVLFVLEDPALRRASDRTHFAKARELGRTLVTLDADFLDDRRFPLAESAGVLVLSAADERALTRILRHVDHEFFARHPESALPLQGQKVRLSIEAVAPAAR